jgi:DNA-binding CsgD family transcriptional regulator
MPQTYLNSFINSDLKALELFWHKFKPDNNNAISYADKWQQQVPFFEQISAQNSVFVLLWDVVTNRFIYAVDKRNVAGYDMSLYLAPDGVNFTISKIHPDFLVGGLLMQQKGFEYVVQNKGIERNKIIVNIDGVYKKSNGEYFHFLQQIVCIESDATGHPLLCLSYIHDITYIKKEKTANLAITSPGEVKLWNFNFDKQTLEPIPTLSAQERKVLSYLGKGKNSKEIAGELHLSSHTIDTHRRNLLKKTNCLDTTGLVTYAKLVGLF